MATIYHGDRTQELSLNQERMLNQRDLICSADTHAESFGDFYVICGGHSRADVDAVLDATDIFRSNPSSANQGKLLNVRSTK